jgi:hypothetical protein
MRPARPNEIQKSTKKKLSWITKKTGLLAVALLILVCAVGWLFYQKNSEDMIDPAKYQSVFLVNGQVYFGKLEKASGDYFRLTDIWYLQLTQPLQPEQSGASAAQSNPELIKLGDEMHGPEDEMIIKDEQILFFENLKDSGKVVETIKTNQNKNNNK